MLETICWILLAGPVVAWFIWGWIINVHLSQHYRGPWRFTWRGRPGPEEYTPEGQRWLARARVHGQMFFFLIIYDLLIATSVCRNAHLGGQ